jgi:competence protein ComGC
MLMYWVLMSLLVENILKRNNQIFNKGEKAVPGSLVPNGSWWPLGTASSPLIEVLQVTSHMKVG